MNNIIIDNDKVINLEENTNIEIKKDSILTIKTSNNEIKINIIINKNINSYINVFNIDSSLSLNVDVLEDSKLTLTTASINNNDLTLKEDINHKKGAISEITNHGINVNNGNMKFIINGIIKKGMSKTSTSQDNKIINLKDGNSLIEPNLLIDEFDCYAQHAAYISKYNMEEIFYLQSRGIDEKEIFRLLTRAFLLGKMKLEDNVFSKYVEEINKI